VSNMERFLPRRAVKRKRFSATAAKATGVDVAVGRSAGSGAVGALAIAALAVAAGAIGSLAIGRLRVRRGKFNHLRIDELDVGHLKVEQLELPPGAGLPQSGGGADRGTLPGPPD
jgi:hypothetical protein